MPKTQLTSKISSFLQEEIDQLFKQARLRIRYCGVRVLTASTSATCARILIVTPKACGNALSVTYSSDVSDQFSEKKVLQLHKKISL